MSLFDRLRVALAPKHTAITIYSDKVTHSIQLKITCKRKQYIIYIVDRATAARVHNMHEAEVKVGAESAEGDTPEEIALEDSRITGTIRFQLHDQDTLIANVELRPLVATVTDTRATKLVDTS